MSVIERLADIAPERVRPLRRVEYEKIVADGLFDGERIELLDGVIVELSRQDPRHAATVQRLTQVFAAALMERAHLRIQLPLAVSDQSLPEPDVALVRPGDYDAAHPATAFLAIEVADASLRKDRSVKADLYAGAGIDEYWVVNLVDGLVEVHTEPAGDHYTRVTPVHQGASVRLRAFPDVEIPVSAILR